VGPKEFVSPALDKNPMAKTSVTTENSLTGPMRTTLAGIAVVAWFALVLQFLLMVQQAAPGRSLFAVVNYFSFFTILTNLLVALGASLPLVAPQSAAGQFFLRPSIQSATAVYIAIVGITYSLLLRQLWNPQGAQKIADVLLHDVVPVLYVAFWIFLVPKATLRWSDAVRWLAFPLVYMAYTLVRGFVSHWYPYYFIDVDTIGLSRALLHASQLLFAFLGLGLLFIAIGRWTARSSPTHDSVT
jgi:hypothetical protein